MEIKPSGFFKRIIHLILIFVFILNTFVNSQLNKDIYNQPAFDLGITINVENDQSKSLNAAATPVITSISPSSINSQYFGYLGITGSNFVNGNTKVIIGDKYECTINSVSTTKVYCLPPSMTDLAGPTNLYVICSGVKSNVVKITLVPPEPGIVTIESSETPAIPSVGKATLQIGGVGTYIVGITKCYGNDGFKNNITCEINYMSIYGINCNIETSNPKATKMDIYCVSFTVYGNSMSFTILNPVAQPTSIIPANINALVAMPVTIVGTKFVSVEQTKVLINGSGESINITPTSVNYTHIIFQTPALSIGRRNISVLNNATSASVSLAVVYVATPSIDTIYPTSVVIGSINNKITMVGKRFDPTSAVPLFTFSNGTKAPIVCNIYEQNSNTIFCEIVEEISIAETTLNIQVDNGNGYVSNIKTLLITPKSPVLIRSNPSTINSGVYNTITVYGNNFKSNVKVSINNGIDCPVGQLFPNNFVVVTIPPLQPGIYPLVATNDLQYTSNSIDIKVAAVTPSISSIWPTEISIYVPTRVTITGSNFQVGVSTVKIGTYDCPIYSMDDSILFCMLEAFEYGTVPVNVYTYNLQSNTLHVELINPLPINQVNPPYYYFDQVNVGVTILGQGFLTDTYSRVEFIDNTQSDNTYECMTTSRSETEIICSPPFVPVGSYNIIVHIGSLHSNTANIDVLDRPMSCLSINGESVTWWFARKIPQSQSYIYFDSKSSQVQYISSISSPSSCLGKTLSQIKQLNNSFNGYILYNDHPWFDDLTGGMSNSVDGFSPNLKKSLGKGILVSQSYFSITPGFHIKHSLEGFPVPLKSKNTKIQFKSPSDYADSWFPNDYHLSPTQTEDDISLGHSFLCNSFTDSKSYIDSISVIKPFIYSSNRYNNDGQSSNIFTPLFKNPVSSSYQSKDWNSTDGVFISSGFKIDIFTPIHLMPLSITLPSKFKLPVGSNAITETKLQDDFIIQHNIDSKHSQWKSDFDRSVIAFNDSHLCLGDYSKDTIMGGGMAICIKPPIIGDFLTETVFKYQTTNCTTLTCTNQIQNQFIVSLKSKMYMDNKYIAQSSNTNDINIYLEAVGNDLLIRNTYVGILDEGCFGIFCPLDANFNNKLLEFTTDEYAMFTFRGIYVPLFKLLLKSSDGSIRVKQSNGDIFSIPTLNHTTFYFPDISEGGEKVGNIIFSYKILHMVKKVRDELGFGKLGSLELVIDLNTGIAILNDHHKIPININTLDVQSLFRSVSYDLAIQLNSGILSLDLPQLELDVQSTSESSVLLGGIVNLITMKLRELVFPTLPLNILQSLRDSSTGQSINIEHFSSSRSSRMNGVASQGWITAFLWDLVDSNNDDPQDSIIKKQPYDITLDNQIDFKSILNATSLYGLNDGVLSFSNQLYSMVPKWDSFAIDHAKSIMRYNNIQKCNYCKIENPSSITNNSSFQEVIQSFGVCLPESNAKPSVSEVEFYASFWIDSQSKPRNWLTNQGIKLLYESNTYKNSPLLESLLKVADPTLCEFGYESGYAITFKGFELFTRVLWNQINIADKHIQYNDVDTYFISTGNNNGLAIITYMNNLCAFDIVNESEFNNGQILSLCPNGPIVNSISGLSGPTRSSNNAITLVGRKLSETGFIVQVGTKDCQIQDITTDSNGNDQLICLVGEGTGILPIKYFNKNSLLPTENSLSMYVFKYDIPLITSISSGTSPVSTFGEKVTVFGKNFGFSNQDTRLSVDDSMFSIDLFIYDSTTGTEGLVFTPKGTGEEMLINIIVDGQSTVQKQENSITFKSPIINSISVNTSPTAGGGLMTVIGSYFTVPNTNSDLSKVQVFIGETECDETEHISDTILVCTIPPSWGINEVSVRIGSLLSSNGPTFTYPLPVIHQIIQPHIVNTSIPSYYYVIGTDLGSKGYTPYNISLFETIYSYDCDTDFETYMNKEYYDDNGDPIEVPTDPYSEGSFDPYILIDKTYRTTVNFDCVKCLLDPGIGFDIPVNHSIEEDYFSNIFRGVSYNRPTILEIKEKNGNTDGNFNITITGYDFVPNEINKTIDDINQNPLYVTLEGPTTYSNVSIGTQLLNEVVYLNSSLIIGKVQPGIGVDLNITLFIGGQNSIENFKFSYNKPTILSMTSTNTNGGLITIDGANFVPSNVQPYNSNITINNQSCSNIEWINSTRIICIVKYGIGLDLPVLVFIGNQSVVDKYSYNMPSIINENYKGSPSGGDWITIKGESFVPSEISKEINEKTQDSNNSISIDGNLCQLVEWIDHNNARCQVPSGSGINKEIKVVVGTQSSKSNQYFNYLAPSVISISPNSGERDQNTLVTIIGKYFGANPTVIIGDIGQCTNVLILEKISGNDRLQCNVPKAESNGKQLVTVTLNGQRSNDSSIFYTYTGQPTIYYISPTTGTVEGEFEITISGKFLKDDKNSPTVLFNMKNTEISDSSSDFIKFKALKGGGTNIPIQVLVGTDISNTNTDFSYNAPNINSITPSEGHADKATPVIIEGTDLGLVGSGYITEIMVGPTLCSNLQVESSSIVSCTIQPPNVPGEANVILFFYSQSSTSKFTFVREDSSASESQETTTTTTTTTTVSPTTGVIPVTTLVPPIVITTLVPPITPVITTNSTTDSTTGGQATTGEQTTTSTTDLSTTSEMTTGGSQTTTTGIPSTTGTNSTTDPSTTGAATTAPSTSTTTVATDPSTTGLPSTSQSATTGASSTTGTPSTTDASTTGTPSTTDASTTGTPSTTDASTTGTPSTTDGSTTGAPSTTDGSTTGTPSTTDASTTGTPSTTDASTTGTPSTTDASTTGTPSTTDASTTGTPSTTDASTTGTPSTTDTSTTGTPSTTDASTTGTPSTTDTSTTGTLSTTDASTTGTPSTTDASTTGTPSTTDASTTGTPSTTDASTTGTPSTTDASTTGTPSTTDTSTTGTPSTTDASTTGTPSTTDTSTTGTLSTTDASTTGTPSTTDGSTTGTPSTTDASTTGTPSTTDASTTGAPSTTDGSTTGTPSTTDASTTGAPSTTDASTTGTPSTTDASTTGTPSTTDASTTGTPSTTDASTTGTPSTTDASTTGAPSTTEPATTGQSTTGQSTTEPATTGQETTAPATTGQSTTGQTTTSPATTGQSTTAPATTGQSTTGQATTGQATTGQSTTESATTGQATTGQSTTGQATGQATTAPAITDESTTGTPSTSTTGTLSTTDGSTTGTPSTEDSTTTGISSTTTAVSSNSTSTFSSTISTTGSTSSGGSDISTTGGISTSSTGNPNTLTTGTTSTTGEGSSSTTSTTTGGSTSTTSTTGESSTGTTLTTSDVSTSSTSTTGNVSTSTTGTSTTGSTSTTSTTSEVSTSTTSTTGEVSTSTTLTTSEVSTGSTSTTGEVSTSSTSTTGDVPTSTTSTTGEGSTSTSTTGSSNSTSTTSEGSTSTSTTGDVSTSTTSTTGEGSTSITSTTGEGSTSTTSTTSDVSTSSTSTTGEVSTGSTSTTGEGSTSTTSTTGEVSTITTGNVSTSTTGTSTTGEDSTSTTSTTGEGSSTSTTSDVSTGTSTTGETTITTTGEVSTSTTSTTGEGSTGNTSTTGEGTTSTTSTTGEGSTGNTSTTGEVSTSSTSTTIEISTGSITSTTGEVSTGSTSTTSEGSSGTTSTTSEVSTSSTSTTGEVSTSSTSTTGEVTIGSTSTTSEVSTSTTSTTGEVSTSSTSTTGEVSTNSTSTTGEGSTGSTSTTTEGSTSTTSTTGEVTIGSTSTTSDVSTSTTSTTGEVSTNSTSTGDVSTSTTSTTGEVTIGSTSTTGEGSTGTTSTTGEVAIGTISTAGEISTSNNGNLSTSTSTSTTTADVTTSTSNLSTSTAGEGSTGTSTTDDVSTSTTGNLSTSSTYGTTSDSTTSSTTSAPSISGPAFSSGESTGSASDSTSTGEVSLASTSI